jgi:hypothetical protein
MLAKFMAIPHHTYLIMKMSTPNGILSVLGDIMVSYNCESATVELSKDSAVKAAATVMVAQAAKIEQTALEVPEQKHTMLTDKRCIPLRSASVRTPHLFTTGFPRFLSIRGARGLQAFDQQRHTSYLKP